MGESGLLRLIPTRMSFWLHANRIIWKNRVCEAWSNTFYRCGGYYHNSPIELPVERTFLLQHVGGSEDMDRDLHFTVPLL